MKDLIKILNNFKGIEFIDIEANEFTDHPPTLIIRAKEDDTVKDWLDTIANKDVTNPNLSDNISYKDLLDNLN